MQQKSCCMSILQKDDRVVSPSLEIVKDFQRAKKFKNLLFFGSLEILERTNELDERSLVYGFFFDLHRFSASEDHSQIYCETQCDQTFHQPESIALAPLSSRTKMS